MIQLDSRLKHLILVLAAVTGMANAAQAQGIAIDATNFPDEKFRNHVSSTYDTNSDGSLSDEEIAAVTTINVSNKNIANLKGIEHFTALTELQCRENQLTTLDVSANTALTTLYCQYNQLTTLDVSKNTALMTLYCFSNKLTTLDLSANTALMNLSCNINQLTTLDLSANTALKMLYCSYGQLTTLDVSANTALTLLYCGSNQLTTLDLSANTALTELDCRFNQLTTLDVSANTALTKLDCSYGQLTTLDLSANTALTYLSCSSNQLTTLDVSNTALTYLRCPNNQIKGEKMLALVNSLPAVTGGEFYVVDTQDSNEGNVITKAQVNIAKNKGWTVYCFIGYNIAEYAGVEVYVLTLGIPSNGTLTATSNGSVGEGTAVILTATPDEGYKLKTLKAYKTGDESQTVAISENKFTMPAFDVTVTAEFEAITYTLTYAAGEGGTIVGSTSQTVAHGQSGTEVEAKPNEGYKFMKWSDGNTNAKRTDTNVQVNLSVTAEFEKSSTTGLFDAEFEALSVYPNPTAGQLWVSVPELAEGTAAEVLVYNANGQLLQRVAARAASTGSAAAYGRISIDLSAYPNGIYFIRVGNAVAKVVKQ